MFDGDAMRELLQQQRESKVLRVNSREYLVVPTAEGAAVAELDTPDVLAAPLSLATLSSVVEYVKTNVDALDLALTLAHVVDEGTVHVLSTLRGS